MYPVVAYKSFQILKTILNFPHTSYIVFFLLVDVKNKHEFFMVPNHKVTALPEA